MFERVKCVKIPLQKRSFLLINSRLELLRERKRSDREKEQEKEEEEEEEDFRIQQEEENAHTVG